MTILQDIHAGAIPAQLTVDKVYELTAAGIFAENESFELIDGEIVPMAAAKAGRRTAGRSDDPARRSRLGFISSRSWPI